MIGLHAPFRRATPEDASAIADLCNAARSVARPGRSEPTPENTIVGDDGRVFAVLSGRPADGETWQVELLAVAPERSFDEFGSRLLAIADALAADEGLFSVRLAVESPTEELRAILEREGFRAAQEKGATLSMTRPVVPQG